MRLNSMTWRPIKKPFYQRTWFLVLSLIFLSPLGVFLWYKFRLAPKTKLCRIGKKVASITLILFWLIMAIGLSSLYSYIRSHPVEQTLNNSSNAKTEEKPKQEEPKEPKIDFYTFVGWYGNNKNAIMSKCGNADWVEQQTLDCLKDVYKDSLDPELFTKANENDKANLISAVARICGGVSKYGDVDTAEALYKKWSVKE